MLEALGEGTEKKQERTEDAGKLEAGSIMMMTYCRSSNNAEKAGAKKEDDDDERKGVIET